MVSYIRNMKSDMSCWLISPFAALDPCQAQVISSTLPSLFPGHCFQPNIIMQFFNCQWLRNIEDLCPEDYIILSKKSPWTVEIRYQKSVCRKPGLSTSWWPLLASVGGLRSVCQTCGAELQTHCPSTHFLWCCLQWKIQTLGSFLYLHESKLLQKKEL